MKVKSLYHVGIPVDDLDRAQKFYTEVLGMQLMDRVGGNPNNPDALEIHGKVQRLDRLRCGNDDVVLFERPRPIRRDALDRYRLAGNANGILHAGIADIPLRHLQALGNPANSFKSSDAAFLDRQVAMFSGTTGQI